MSEKDDVPSFCAKCGAALPSDSSFCPKCGAPVHPELRPSEGQETAKKPWYFSTPVLFLTLLLLTPLGTVLILADRRQRIWTKICAVIIGFVYVMYLGPVLLRAPLLSTIIGPAEIDFGADYVESAGSVSVADPKSQFSYGEQFAWVVHLRGPVGSTRVDLVLAKRTPSGGEQVIERTPMDIADPQYNTLFGKGPLWLLTGSGHYKLRVVSGQRILAEGEFEFR